MKLGIICGMAAEAKALGPVRKDPRVRVGISAARPDRATALAEEMVDGGVDMLVSWGIAGALDPGLQSGALLVPEAVTGPEKDVLVLAGCDAPEAEAGRIAGSDSVVVTPEEKARLHATTGTRAVDMETHRIAMVGHRRAVPCMAIRAISDPAHRALPPGTEDALDDAGRPRVLPVLAGLLAHPWRLGALMHAKRDLDTALATLSGRGVEALTRLLD